MHATNRGQSREDGVMVPWVRIVVTALVAVLLVGASVFAVAALVPRDSSESLPDGDND